eukprot:403348981
MQAYNMPPPQQNFSCNKCNKGNFQKGKYWGCWTCLVCLGCLPGLCCKCAWHRKATCTSCGHTVKL